MPSNILFIAIDSLRANYCYDHKKSYLTPNLDQIIKKGTYFTESITCADGTSLVLGSIFTGLYPYRSGINSYVADTEKPNFFNHLGRLGYNLYTTVPYYVGVDLLISNFLKRGDSSILTSEFESKFEHLDDGYGDDILKRLDENNLKEPWFQFIYLADLHMSNVSQTMVVPKRFDSEEFGENKYEKMISLIDDWLGKFLTKIDLKSTLVVLISDHGDYIPINEKRETDYIPAWTKTVQIGKKLLPKSFRPTAKKLTNKTRTIVQQKRFDYATRNLTELEKRNSRTRAGSYLFDDLVRTPLIFYGNNITEGKLVKNQVGNVSIFPTILDLVGLPQMNEEIDGESLVPLLKGESNKSNPVYMETASISKESLLGKVVGIRTSEYKYFRSRKSPKENVHLYDLQNDPLEENNLAKITPEIVKNMESILLNFLEKLEVSPDAEFDDVEAKLIEFELKRLGYM
jgi:arylsulfatase A-like enzyme